jgi:TetR/AcrR family transcriptional regulator, cholesterol catabolism regulator
MMNRKSKKTLRGNKLQQISKVAATLFFEKGYMQTTTKEIAEACDISVGTLYYYIKSKDDFPIIFSQIHKNDVDPWEKEVRKEMEYMPPEEILKKAVREFTYGVDRRQKMILFWYNASKYLNREQLKDVTDVEIKVVNLFKDIIEMGCQRGQFKSTDPFITGYSIFMLTHTWALKRWWLKRLYTIEEYAKICEELAVSMARGNTI